MSVEQLDTKMYPSILSLIPTLHKAQARSQILLRKRKYQQKCSTRKTSKIFLLKSLREREKMVLKAVWSPEYLH